MNNADQINEAHEGHLRHTSLMLAAMDLESATYAARKAREDLRRATRNRLTAKERHDDARTAWTEAEPEDGQLYGMRTELLAWALDNATRDEGDALDDYRTALKRIEVVGAAVGEADSHDVPSYLRHRARKAIALADAFGNKVAMDATLHDGLERPVLPELSPEVEVQDLRVIDPLEPVEAWTPPESRAVLVPLEDYSQKGPVQRYADTGNPYSALGNDAEGPEDLEDPAAGGWKPEHMSPEWWKRVTFSAPLNVKDPLPEDPAAGGWKERNVLEEFSNDGLDMIPADDEDENEAGR